MQIRKSVANKNSGIAFALTKEDQINIYEKDIYSRVGVVFPCGFK
jgi:hypothetical protein